MGYFQQVKGVCVEDIAIVLPAAGASRRMRGRDKLLEDLGGMPLLRRQALRALATGARVLVTLPPDRPARAEALTGLGVDLIVVPDAALGMAGSLRAAAGWAGAARALMVVLPDMPDIDTQHLKALMTAFKAAPARVHRGGTSDGRAGHPVLFPASCFAQMAGLAGDEGARSVIAQAAAPALITPLPDDLALRDLDTPEDWALWRAEHPDGPSV